MQLRFTLMAFIVATAGCENQVATMPPVSSEPKSSPAGGSTDNGPSETYEAKNDEERVKASINKWSKSVQKGEEDPPSDYIDTVTKLPHSLKSWHILSVEFSPISGEKDRKGHEATALAKAVVQVEYADSKSHPLSGLITFHLSKSKATNYWAIFDLDGVNDE